MNDPLYFATWMFTFQTQLRVLQHRLSKAVAKGGEHMSDDFGDFCLYIYNECPDLIDYHQN